MSKTEILDELSKLSLEERREIRRKLDELEGVEWLDDGELTSQEKRLILDRLDACENHPENVLPWEQVKASLRKRFN